MLWTFTIIQVGTGFSSVYDTYIFFIDTWTFLIFLIFLALWHFRHFGHFGTLLCPSNRPLFFKKFKTGGGVHPEGWEKKYSTVRVFWDPKMKSIHIRSHFLKIDPHLSLILLYIMWCIDKYYWTFWQTINRSGKLSSWTNTKEHTAITVLAQLHKVWLVHC